MIAMSTLWSIVSDFNCNDEGNYNGSLKCVGDGRGGGCGVIMMDLNSWKIFPSTYQFTPILPEPFSLVLPSQVIRSKETHQPLSLKNKHFGEKGTLLHCWWECKLIQPLWRTVWRFLKKLKIELPYDPPIPLLGIYLEKTTIQKDTCTPVFTAALFTVARSWKQPKCPQTDEWIKKLWYIYTMEYYSAIKSNEIESFVETWMDLETVIQSEVSQKEENKYSILTHICGI